MKVAVMKELPGSGALIDLVQWAGHTCVPVASAAALRSMLRSQTIDLLIFPWIDEAGSSVDMLRVYRDFTSYRLPAIAAVPDTAPAAIQRAFDGGADDCIVMPCSEAEIVVRLNVTLRRNYPRQFMIESYLEGPYRIDPLLREISLLGELLELTPSEFASAHCFFSNLGRPLSREYVNGYCGRRYAPGSARIIDQHVCNLRRKLRFDASSLYAIKSLYSFGYQMCMAPVSVQKAAGPENQPHRLLQLLAA